MKWSQEYLCRRFEYKDGSLFWKDHPSQAYRNGKTAGYCRKDGYVFVKIDGISTAVHKIIWCMLTGEWIEYPEYEIDHKDRNPSNNRFENLKKVTKSQNQDNTKCRGNSTGIKGVYFDNYHERYKASICIDSKLKHLGYYDTLRQAIEVRKQAEEKRREGDFDSWYISKREEFLGKRVCTRTQSDYL